MHLPPELRRLQATAEDLLRQGRVLEAIEAFEQLLRIEPRLPDAWYNLAFLQNRARRFEAALGSYGQALAQGVGGAEEVHLNRAVILADHLARHDEAEAELRTALALQPRYVPALVNLGNLCEQRGERAAALEAYDAALAVDPANALALSRLPHLKPPQRADDPLIGRLRQAIAQSRPAEQADLGFALGKALDDAKAYDDAFAAYTAANAASRAAGGGVRYDAAAHERCIDSLVAAFPEPGRAIEPSRPGSGPRLVFVCGMFRSGSTLVERILASHPHVTAGGEVDLLPALMRERFGPMPQIVAPLDAATLAHWRARYLDRVSTMFPGAACITDKRPDNFLYIGLIRHLFPDAVIVHTRRHPLDNCLSIYFLHLSQAMPHALDLLDTAHWYRQYERLMAHWQRLHGDAIHDVDYDALVAEPEPVVAALLRKCALPWDERCLTFHEGGGVVATPSGWQVRRPFYTASSGRWRHYERHLDALRAALGLPRAGHAPNPP
jgi:Tfp pilus assembly protein PilF